ncbi:MAG: phage holin family protein [Actinobacteria bacterium]|nr:phage holin family protein [Actinomycetota bacterium]
MKLLIRLAITAAALWVAVWLIPGLDFEGGVLGFILVAALVLAANAIVKPILSIFSFPLILLTLGLFLLVINALVLQLVVWLSSQLDLGLTSTGFFWATFLGALVISLVRMVLDAILD